MIPLGSIFLAIVMMTPQGLQQYASNLVNPYEVKCMIQLWDKESRWRYQAKSPTDDYGIPQRHMRGKSKAQIHAFITSPVEQIDWGIKYVRHRYGDFCTALNFHLRFNYY